MRTTPLSEEERELLEIASALLLQRFSPGRHHVASALLLESGDVHTGVHVGSRRVNVCAEQVALGSALTTGEISPRSIASVIMMDHADVPTPTSPCGVCREVLAYYAPSLKVVVATPTPRVSTARALLPAPWLLPGELEGSQNMRGVTP